MNTYDDIREITMEGFQVVSGDLFRKNMRSNLPTVTFWPNSISFSKASLVALNACERIRIEINSQKRCMLIVPVTEKDKDNVRWLKRGKEPSAKKIECIAFTSQLYESWGWKKELAYRAVGQIVTADRKIMLLYDFSSPETWQFKDKTKET